MHSPQEWSGHFCQNWCLLPKLMRLIGFENEITGQLQHNQAWLFILFFITNTKKTMATCEYGRWRISLKVIYVLLSSLDMSPRATCAFINMFKCLSNLWLSTTVHNTIKEREESHPPLLSPNMDLIFFFLWNRRKWVSWGKLDTTTKKCYWWTDGVRILLSLEVRTTLCIYHDQIGVLITKRPIWQPNLSTT